MFSSGINNFDPVLVRNVARAAEEGGASHIDIACDAELVRVAKGATRLPVCVSSVLHRFLCRHHNCIDLLWLYVG